MASRSEDLLGQKWDKCLTNAAIKMGAGLTLGAVFSLVLFRRRAWPIIFGLGSGFGMAYNECQNEFNQSVLLRAYKLKEKEQVKK